jgi:peptidyl-prolyl cis-trans isomerase B (cyclophilin B)
MEEKAYPKVLLSTSLGDITIELAEAKAPVTVKSFLDYVNSGFFNGTIFHRVIPDFMIQGGGFTEDMKQKATECAITNEADNGLKNDRGTIAMARTPDPHSASCQFFINLKNNSFLNHSGKTPQGWGYAVFGWVTEGMKVVDAIAQVQTGSFGPHQDVPQTPVVINEARVVE